METTLTGRTLMPPYTVICKKCGSSFITYVDVIGVRCQCGSTEHEQHNTQTAVKRADGPPQEETPRPEKPKLEMPKTKASPRSKGRRKRGG